MESELQEGHLTFTYSQKLTTIDDWGKHSTLVPMLHCTTNAAAWNMWVEYFLFNSKTVRYNNICGVKVRNHANEKPQEYPTQSNLHMDFIQLMPSWNLPMHVTHSV